MKTRQTSIDCYNQIKSEGLLSELRLLTYYSMLHSAPCTAGELQEYIDKNQVRVKHAWKLLSQLRDLGVVYERAERVCNISGRNVIEWDLTDRLPVASKTPANTKKERVKNTVNALRKLYTNKDTSTDEDWINLANLIKHI